MTDNTLLSRRLAFGRIGAIALATFAVPTLLTATSTFADDGKNGGDGGKNGDGGDTGGEGDGGKNGDGGDTPDNTGDDSNGDGGDTPPAASKGSSVAKKKKGK